MSSIHKRIIIENIIMLIVLFLIGILLSYTNLASIKDINIYVIVATLPFFTLYTITLISSIKVILFICFVEINKKKLSLNIRSNIIEAKIDKIKKYKLSSEGINKYYYQIICHWINPLNHKKYKFKSGYLWNYPLMPLDEIDVHFYKNYQNYYVDLTEIEKWDNEQKNMSNIEERKYLTFKFNYNLKDSYIDDNFLIGYDTIREKKVKISISKIKKVTKLIYFQEMLKIYLYTFDKQIEISKNYNDNLDELTYSLLAKVSDKCKIED